MSVSSFELVVDCRPASRCGDIEEKTKEIKEQSWESYENFLDEVKKMSLSFDIQFFTLDVVNNERTILKVEKKPIVRKIDFNGKDIDEELALKRLPIRVGFPYPDINESEAERTLEVWLSENGHTKPKAKIRKKIKNDKYNIVVDMNYESTLFVDNVELVCDVQEYCQKFLKNTFSQFEGRRYKTIDMKSFATRIIREIVSEGFPEAKLTFSTTDRNNIVDVVFNLVLGKRIQFAFEGDLLIPEAVLRDYVKKEATGFDIKKMDETISSLVERKYKEMGFFATDVGVRKLSYKSRDNVSVDAFYVRVKKGYRYRVSDLRFLGNSAVTNNKLRDLFYEGATTLASRDLYDESYVQGFSETLREFYLKIGFVYVEIGEPEIQFDQKNKIVKVIYVIKERQRSVIQAVNILGLSKETMLKAKASMKNKKGNPLDIIGLENDILSAVSIVRDAGYYFAKLVDTGDVVNYSSNFTESEITLKFFTGKKAILDEVVLSGNVVTDKEVLLREITIKKGEPVTPKLLKNTKDALNSLGLFSQVSITPVIKNEKLKEDYGIRLVIEVKEREFGRVEIAPGFRSDLGAKFSLSFLKNNLWGKNHSFQTKLLLNRRFSFSGLDQSRIKDGHKIEGLLKLGYSWPYLYSGISFDTSLSFQRRRFFSFDADIARLSPQFAKQWNSVLSTTFKYQFEQIRQYDAINNDENANFRIGGITPSLTLDFRDSPISPRSGSFFGLSWEYTAPALGSQDDESIEINFSKVISRNKFYIPVAKKRFVFAINLAVGYQKNYARDLQRDIDGNTIAISGSDDNPRTRGYIPSIKVFRLDGFDLVRGFSDNEINRLEQGIDITLTRVQGEAYFANFKFEPRYYINDNFVFGVFFDAGRVFVNSFQPLALRSAVGVTMKLLTPVGSLDFDYGIKTNPISLPQGGQEGFGRFHLNVGTF